MKRVYTLLLGMCLGAGSILQSQAQPIPFDSDQWEIEAQEHRIETYRGQESLYLQGGGAALKDIEATNGILEFDMAFSSERTFAGVFWRMVEAGNYENFYIRPHQSGNPDANQYTPVFNGLSGWQLYYGERYAAPVEYTFDEWLHIKIVFSGKQAEFYLGDVEEPTLVAEMKRDVQPGQVGVTASSLAPTRFANFSFTALDNPPLRGRLGEPETAPEGTFMAWQVSNTFSEASLEKAYGLSAAHKDGLTWTRMEGEGTGVVNLARLQGPSEGENTVFARVTLVSDREQVKKVSFGYSDRVYVYLNDQLLYSGQNVFVSRDYRYLGTIGFFDEVYLHLREGENELWMAVAEDFGGWGLKALIEDRTGLTVRE